MVANPVKKTYLNCFGAFVSAGEIWIDRAGNECFFRENGTISCRTVNTDPSMAIQSEKDSCDINLIVQKYKRTGLMSNLRTDEPRYGDFSNAVDYHDAIFRAQQAEDSFMLLPAHVRARFSNDPGKLIDFLADENNRSEAVKLGLVNPPQDSQIPQGGVTTPSKEGEQKPPTSTSS